MRTAITGRWPAVLAGGVALTGMITAGLLGGILGLVPTRRRPAPAHR